MVTAREVYSKFARRVGESELRIRPRDIGTLRHFPCFLPCNAAFENLVRAGGENALDVKRREGSKTNEHHIRVGIGPSLRRSKA